MPYAVEFTAESQGHFLRLSAHEQRTVRDTLATQLRYEPAVATRNRKPLHANPYATWELRVGDLRILYDIEDDRRVLVVLIGRKRGDRLIVGGEEITLT